MSSNIHFINSCIAGTFLLITFAFPLRAQEETTSEQQPAMDPNDSLVLNDDGIWLHLSHTGNTVGDALRAASITWTDQDRLIPNVETPLTSTSIVFLTRQRTVTVHVGSEAPQELTTYSNTVGDLLTELEISLNSEDHVAPHHTMPLADSSTVTVTRVQEQTLTEEEKIPPPVEILEDSALPLGTDQVSDPGTSGAAKLTIHVRTENGEEVERTVLKREVIQEPQPRIVRRGTKLVVLGAEIGRASWYRGPEKTAAHRSLPLGTRLRIVRTDTDASTIVLVSDRGPFTPGRIVDLSKDAFRALAPLTVGTIPVRVERLP